MSLEDLGIVIEKGLFYQKDYALDRSYTFEALVFLTPEQTKRFDSVYL